MGVHPLANVSAVAHIHDSARIEAFVTIHDKVAIGAGTQVGAGAVIYNGITIGENCRIMPGVVLSASLDHLGSPGNLPQNGNVIIGDQVHIEPNVTIHGNVEIGHGTWIGSGVTIHDGAKIGNNCRIFPNAIISAIPQDLKYHGERTQTVIGDGTTIRECVTINRGTDASGTTIVGRNCLIMAYAHVAHDCIIGDNCVLANAVQLAGHVEVDDFAILGGTSAVHQFIKIGKHAMVGGGSLVNKDVPPYIVVSRFPVQYQGINIVGLKRRGFSEDAISLIKEAYRFLFLSKLNISRALEQMEANLADTPERAEIIHFVRESSAKGIVKSPGKNNRTEED